MTLSELREFDGLKNDGRILIAVNGKIFDVTRGKSFYGPGKCRQSLLSEQLRAVGLNSTLNIKRWPVRSMVFFI